MELAGCPPGLTEIVTTTSPAVLRLHQLHSQPADVQNSGLLVYSKLFLLFYLPRAIVAIVAIGVLFFSSLWIYILSCLL